MKILYICGALILIVVAGFFVYGKYLAQGPSSGLVVTNNYNQPIASVALKDSKGVICAVTNVPPGATQRCSATFREDGPIFFELQTAKLKKSSLIGFAKPGMHEVFDVELNRDGSVGWGATVSSIAIGFPPAKQH